MKRDRALFLLLLLNGYHAKAFLSGNLSNPSVDADLQQAVPKFALVYQCWQPAAELSSLPLAELNRLFEGPALREEEVKRDYNHMVSSILELSKTYNIGGNRQSNTQKGIQEKEKQEKSLQCDLDQCSEQLYPDFLLEGREEAENGCMLQLSSGKSKGREFCIMDINESRNIFDSRNNSEPSLLGSGLRQRTGIKPTYSFFDDI
jgi:hypothetical protein